MPEVLDAFAEKSTLIDFQRDVRFGERGFDFVYVTDVLINLLGEDDYIVYVDEGALPFEFREYHVQGTLERRGRVG